MRVRNRETRRISGRNFFEWATLRFGIWPFSPTSPTTSRDCILISVSPDELFALMSSEIVRNR